MNIELEWQKDAVVIHLENVKDKDYDSIIDLENHAALELELGLLTESIHKPSDPIVLYSSMKLRIENPTPNFKEYLAVWCFKS